MPVTEGVVELIFDTMNTSRLEVRWIGEGRKVLFLHGCPTTTDLFDEIATRALPIADAEATARSIAAAVAR